MKQLLKKQYLYFQEIFIDYSPKDNLGEEVLQSDLHISSMRQEIVTSERISPHIIEERERHLHAWYNPQIGVVYNPTMPDWHDKNLHVQKSTQADSRAWRLIWTLVVEFAVKICNIIFICFSDQNSARILEDFIVYSLFLVEMLKWNWQLLKFFL